ncbi:S-adenosyl-L-methionine-dependent methyltransferase [Pseudomassariella vexata]|uniref:S-adenosyl-L-methionine-dependent methyltransferase n=1 Tax=Pseudomassariella vexata TaxID=1141098 RepID=A0A1Y2DWS3_9PEZI|nr:S-adenosyl-L-methionine-dependent methyltransferase [Pseudomassariella vexata]ORY63586.1 S-adenosyl-L-methionine-dependent methyltransferase [Pseudomassariella vexata]
MEDNKVARGAGEDVYLLERHAKEVERLSAQHEFFKTHTEHHLLSPKLLAGNRPLKLLDSGCADGHWLRDLRKQIPDRQMELHGIDIAPALFPPQPAQAASGIELRAHNVTQPFPASWAWKNSFDIIHQRLLVWGVPVSKWPAMMQHHLDILKPGGYMQLVEVEWVPQGPIPDSNPQLQKQVKMQRFFSGQFGMDIDLAYRLEDVLREAGLEDVQKIQFDHGYGASAKDPQMREISSIISTEVFRGLDVKIGDGIPGVATNSDEFHAFLDALRDEVRSVGYNTKINFVSGRKPAPQTQ